RARRRGGRGPSGSAKARTSKNRWPAACRRMARRRLAFWLGSRLPPSRGCVGLGARARAGRAAFSRGTAHGRLPRGHALGVIRRVGKLLQVLFDVLVVEHSFSQVSLTNSYVEVPRGFLTRHCLIPSIDQGGAPLESILRIMMAGRGGAAFVPR